MCIFQSGSDIPPLVRLSLRTLQYLVVPLLSVAILCIGALHLGDCPSEPRLPLWHVVAGSSGLLVPVLYLTFDEINPRLSQSHRALSEVLDNLVVFLLPAYIIFELAWLVTGTVWTFGSSGVSDPAGCARSVYVFSAVVVVNFWLHALTPLAFMLWICCTRIFPYCSYCAYWNIFKTALDNWNRRTRMTLALSIAIPLGLSMTVTGAVSIRACALDDTEDHDDTVTVHVSDQESSNVNNNSSDGDYSLISSGRGRGFPPVMVPAWLVAAGVAVLFAPIVYLAYDKYWKCEEGGPLISRFSKFFVVSYLMCGLIWSVLGFLWVFGGRDEPDFSSSSSTCGGPGSFVYGFAFFSLIVMNVVMDAWIVFKMCVVLHWAFLTDD